MKTIYISDELNHAIWLGGNLLQAAPIKDGRIDLSDVIDLDPDIIDDEPARKCLDIAHFLAVRTGDNIARGEVTKIAIYRGIMNFTAGQSANIDPSNVISAEVGTKGQTINR